MVRYFNGKPRVNTKTKKKFRDSAQPQYTYICILYLDPLTRHCCIKCKTVTSMFLSCIRKQARWRCLNPVDWIADVKKMEILLMVKSRICIKCIGGGGGGCGLGVCLWIRDDVYTMTDSRVFLSTGDNLFNEFKVSEQFCHTTLAKKQ